MREQNTAINGEHGFTLMELLVVVTIVGILAALSIPQYSHYRQAAYDTHAESDLRNGILGQEAAYALAERYVSCDNGECECFSTSNITACVEDNRLPAFRLSPTTEISFTADDEDSSDPSFTAESWSKKGSGKSFTYDSREGKIVAGVSP